MYADKKYSGLSDWRYNLERSTTGPFTLIYQQITYCGTSVGLFLIYELQRT